MDELIAGVTPPTGYCCLVTIKDGAPKQTFFTSRKDMVAAGKAASDAGKNAYFAVAAFKTNSSRTQDNVQALKAFWLDVDCKGRNESEYANKQEGRAAINSFVQTHKLPTPTIVNSGNGWHVYWALEDTISPEVWQPVADQLKLFCLSGALRIDPACTADSARILRIPDTLNYRNNPPDVVELDSPVHITTLEHLTGALDRACEGTPIVAQVLKTPKKRVAKAKKTGWVEVSDATKALTGNDFPPTSFSMIMKRSRNGVGCAQMNRAYNERATLDQTSWWHMLSIAQQCTDRDKVIYRMSEGHPDYTPQATDQKAAETQSKPHGCIKFNETAPGLCTACPHWGKITNPLALGGPEVPTITTPLVIPIVQEQEPDSLPAAFLPVDKAMDALAAFEAEKQVSVVPLAPTGFSIEPETGAIMRGDTTLYNLPIYIHGRIYDGDNGLKLRVRVHTKMDGVRDLPIPSEVMMSKDKLKAYLNMHGVASSDKEIAGIGEYLRVSLKEMQSMKAEQKARNQMGWQVDGAFVIGDREYTKEGIKHCAPTRITSDHQGKFGVSGTLDKWKEMVEVYNRPGFEAFQFGLLLGCASPLLAPLQQTGMIVSYFSDESGLGKTTLQCAINSIWGHPTKLMAQPKDTANSIIHQMCIFNSLPLCIDEYTNKTPQECSDIVYASHTGRDKQRMTGEANVMRPNSLHCSNITFVSANASILDRVSSIKASGEAEHMRTLEFDMRNAPRLPKREADDIFSAMESNYGVAGHAIALMLVHNSEHLRGLLEVSQQRMDAKYNFTSKERIWSVAVSCATVMGYMANKAGILNIDMGRLEAYLVGAIAKLRGVVRANVSNVESVIGEFISAYNGSLLVVNGKPDANGLYSPPRNPNIQSIVGRYEPDTKQLWIVTSQLRVFCNKQQTSFHSVVSATGGELKAKRLGKGTSIDAPNTGCVHYDLANPTPEQLLWLGDF